MSLHEIYVFFTIILQSWALWSSVLKYQNILWKYFVYWDNGLIGDNYNAGNESNVLFTRINDKI